MHEAAAVINFIALIITYRCIGIAPHPKLEYLGAVVSVLNAFFLTENLRYAIEGSPL